MYDHMYTIEYTTKSNGLSCCSWELPQLKSYTVPLYLIFRHTHIVLAIGCLSQKHTLISHHIIRSMASWYPHHIPTMSILFSNGIGFACLLFIFAEKKHLRTQSGWWLSHPFEKWWSESQLGWLFHSQLNEKKSSKPPTSNYTPIPIYKCNGCTIRQILWWLLVTLW